MATLRNQKFDTVKSAMAIAIAGEHDAPAWLHQRFGKAFSPEGVRKAVGPTELVDMDSSITALQDRELFAAVRERSLLFRMRGLRRTAFKTRAVTTGGAVATWVAEGKPLPVHKPTIENVGLDRLKVAGLTVATAESLERAPGFDQLLFSDMVQATAEQIDATLLSISATAVADVSPDSLTSGLTPVDATSNPEVDIRALIEDFEGDLSAAYFTMAPRTAARIAETRIGRDIGVRGGELLGVPVLTSRGAPLDSMALVDPTGIMAAWDEDAQIDVGQGGAIEMTDSNSTQDAPTGAELVSLWQANLYAFRSIAYINWEIARSGSVSVLSGGGADWLAVTS